MEIEKLYDKQKVLYEMIVDIRKRLSTKNINIIQKIKLSEELNETNKELKRIEQKIIQSNSLTIKSILKEKLNLKERFIKIEDDSQKIVIAEITTSIRNKVAKSELKALNNELEKLMIKELIDYKNEVITQQAKINRLLKNKRLGILPTSEILIEENSILYNILNLLSEIEEK